MLFTKNICLTLHPEYLCQIEAYVPESLLYQQIQDFEKRLDVIITRKTLDFQDQAAKSSRRTRSLRIFFSNTTSTQDLGTSSDPASTSRISAWTFKIEGRLLEPPNARKSTTYLPKFSNYVKKAIVELKPDTPHMIPLNSQVIEWNRVPGDKRESDGFEIKGTGSTNVLARVLLFMDHPPDKFKLSPALGELLDIHTETMRNVITALWQYIKSNRLQDPEDRRMFHPDARLLEVFGPPKDKRYLISSVPEMIRRHQLPCDPIVLDYTIRVDKEFHVGPQAFDIEIDVEDPIRERTKTAISPPASIQREIQSYDEKISQIVQLIGASKLRRDFMLAFSKDPVGFLNQWVASQSRDLETILGDTRLNAEEVRRSEFYQSDAVREALFHFLRQKEAGH
eukprot:jgi/Hompol1/6759/HPOL_003716-RA